MWDLWPVRGWHLPAAPLDKPGYIQSGSKPPDSKRVILSPQPRSSHLTPFSTMFKKAILFSPPQKSENCRSCGFGKHIRFCRFWVSACETPRLDNGFAVAPPWLRQPISKENTKPLRGLKTEGFHSIRKREPQGKALKPSFIGPNQGAICREPKSHRGDYRLCQR